MDFRGLTRLTRIAPALAVAAMALGAQPAYPAKVKPVLSLRALAVDMSGEGPAPEALYVTIERWSTTDEIARLRDVLVNQGSDALLAALQKVSPRVGYLQSTTSVGWDLSFAAELPTKDGGRRILVATDRPIKFMEFNGQSRSLMYAFTLAEILLNKDGKGAGKLMPAARVDYDKGWNDIEVENYDVDPIRLNGVQVIAESK